MGKYTSAAARDYLGELSTDVPALLAKYAEIKKAITVLQTDIAYASPTVSPRLHRELNINYRMARIVSRRINAVKRERKMKDTLEMLAIAKVCHEANRAWCTTNGDHSQLEWDIAPKWQIDSAIDGVAHALRYPEAGPEDSHQNWWAAKIADGWTYGEVKNPEAKTHPCMVPYDQLPEFQRKKDALFLAIVRALA